MMDKNETEKSLFLDYLNREIDHLHEEIKLPGWTKWAIVAALASIFWIIISEIEKNLFTFKNIWILLLLILLGYSLIVDIYQITKPRTRRNRTYFYSIENIFYSSSLEILFKVIVYLIIFSIILFISINVGILPFIFGLIRYLLPFIFLIIIYPFAKIITLRTNMKVFIPDTLYFDLSKVGETNKKFRSYINMINYLPIIIDYLVIIIDTYLLIIYTNYYLVTFGMTIDPTTITNVKIAFSIFASIILFTLLIHSYETDPSLYELINIRRELIFENIELSSAKQLTEIAVIGIDKTLLIQMEVSESIATLKNIEKELSLASNKKIINKKEWPAARDDSYSHLKRARKIFLADKRFQTGYKWMLPIYMMIDPSDTQYQISIIKLKEIYLIVKKKYDLTIANWLKLVERYEGKISRKNWEKIVISELAAELPRNN